MYMIMKRKKMHSLMVAFFILFMYAGTCFMTVPMSYAEKSADAGESQSDEIFKWLQSSKHVQPAKSYTPPEQPTVYLTFDDGPSKWTGKVLDILGEEKIKGTFFMIGEDAQAHPDLVKRVVKEGHSIGNHTYDHVYKELYGDFDQYWEQTQHTEQILDQIVGIRPQLIRAPGGTSTNFDAFYFYYLEQAGYLVTDWNVDSGDSTRINVPSQEIIQTIKKTPLQHEMTVLLHDGSGHGTSVEALPEIIRYYKEKGYAFAPLTSDVKPIQFSVVKTKWNRTMTFAHYKDLLSHVQAYAAAHREAGGQTVEQEQQLVKQAEVFTEESGQALAAGNQIPLQVKLGGQDMMIANSQYELTGSTIKLSLRLIMEKLGAEVTWIEARRTALVHLGMYDVEYDLPTHTIHVYAFGQLVSDYHLADIEMEDDTLMVPLSQTLAMVGGRVDDLHVNDTRRIVWIGMRNFLYV
jgi:peptidoglycan/xylan/chitin deacetylase (PgdA/CDA1 family)